MSQHHEETAEGAKLMLPLPLYTELQNRAARAGLSAEEYLLLLLARDPDPEEVEALIGKPATLQKRRRGRRSFLVSGSPKGIRKLGNWKQG